MYFNFIMAIPHKNKCRFKANFQTLTKNPIKNITTITIFKRKIKIIV